MKKKITASAEGMPVSGTWKYWVGSAPDKCDLDGKLPGPHNITKGFVDGRTRMGPWANMCFRCHRLHGMGLGTGSGQKYEPVDVDGVTRWRKTEG